MTLQERILKIVADATENDITQVTLASNQENLVGWDSLAQLSLMTALVAQFPELENNAELSRVASVAEIIDMCLASDR